MPLGSAGQGPILEGSISYYVWQPSKLQFPIFKIEVILTSYTHGIVVRILNNACKIHHLSQAHSRFTSGNLVNGSEMGDTVWMFVTSYHQIHTLKSSCPMWWCWVVGPLGDASVMREEPSWMGLTLIWKRFGRGPSPNLAGTWSWACSLQYCEK